MTDDHAIAMEQLKEKAPQAVELLRQLANANRLLILCHLAEKERSVGQLEADLGIKQPALSQQLADLRQYGLVKTRRQSRSIYYSIADDRAQEVMNMLYEIFCGDGKATTGRAAARPAMAPARPRGDAAQFARITSVTRS
ncbi:MAG: metalloregulator ArsR/SmtB family transcription factor [Brevundimonas sp.]|uniref:ArsR/SmtB family transcription factor n=1 Tax=Brevundimonas sp. TaxID=1871086 RepID=UPI0025C150A8|nr:metalloregulator ArsR/SmtB family transcription factor [Brevundimonas sp.]MCH4267358.1 metalloregulator ArsR/SmtB family transcription factor [Brevundimonas sp.]